MGAAVRAAGYPVWAGWLPEHAVPAAGAAALQPDEGFSEAPPAPGSVGLAVIDLAPIDTPAAQAALALAQDLAQHHRPVVFCARQHQHEAAAAALACGAFGYFVKPVEAGLLARSMPMWLARAAELRRLRQERGSLLDALTASRVVGTAVGILCERHRLTPAEAFDSLRRTARAERSAVAELARRVASGEGRSGTEM